MMVGLKTEGYGDGAPVHIQFGTGEKYRITRRSIIENLNLGLAMRRRPSIIGNGQETGYNSTLRWKIQSESNVLLTTLHIIKISITKALWNYFPLSLQHRRPLVHATHPKCLRAGHFRPTWLFPHGPVVPANLSR